MHEDMYAKICKFWCLLVFMEEGIQVGVGSRILCMHAIDCREGVKSAKGFQNKQH